MKLIRFRIRDFRSIKDSGWVECQNVTAFVGENESGKTTVFLALMKLMDPQRSSDIFRTTMANSGRMAKINLQEDLPIDRHNEILGRLGTTFFISAEFEMTSKIQNYVMELEPNFKGQETFVISKNYEEKYEFSFFDQISEEKKQQIEDFIVRNLPKFMYYKEVTEIKSEVDLLSLALKLNGNRKTRKLTNNETMFSNLLKCLDIWDSNLIKSIKTVYDTLTVKRSEEIDFRSIFTIIPEFKARIKRGFEKLNKNFMKWWGSNELTISFEEQQRGIVIVILDHQGNKFLLQNRSTGFRRFFALFLSFSISSSTEYENSILLFDEAGASLHPLTQVKLANYFNELGNYTQIFYNTHTSYMLSVKNLNRARVIYKDLEMHTIVSDTLTVNESRNNEESLFPVQSALGFYIAEKAFAGCLPIIMLNEWDQCYVSLIKNILIAEKKLNTIYETLIFATGENGIDAAAETFASGKNLPIVFLPSDREGKKVKERLLNTKYRNAKHKVLEVSDFMKDAECFEDIIPSELLTIFSKLYLKEILGNEFNPDQNKALLPQIDAYVYANKIALPDNFRAELAKRMKINTMRYFDDVRLKSKYESVWSKIWKTILAIE